MRIVFFLLGCDGPAPLPADRVWYGQEERDEAGREALSVGILDGSGIASVLVGTPSTSEDWDQNHGGAYLLDADAPDGVLDDVATAAFTGSTVNGFGQGVTIAGDLTGDGRPDVVVLGTDPFVVPESYLRVYAGPLDGTLPVESAWLAMTYDLEIESPSSLTDCGDLNSDGHDDLCIGSTGGVSGTGAVAVFHGPVPPGVLAFADASVLVIGEGGERIEGGSDLDGDGVPELIVQAYPVDGGVYAISAPGTGEARLDDHPYWDGEPDEGSASGLAVGGDLDGDGLPDLFVGAPGWDHVAGRGYVVVDKDGGTLADAHATIDGHRQDWVGFDAAIGDLDGDGAADLAIGAPRNFVGGHERGQVALFLGPVAAGPASLDDADLRFSGSSRLDGFGNTVEAGDVDGDGRDDLVIGAPFDDSEGEQAGAVYVFTSAALFP